MNDEHDKDTDHLDPLPIFHVARRAVECLQRALSPGAEVHELYTLERIDELEAVAREALDLTRLRNPRGRPWSDPTRRQGPIPVPLWWRDEYRDDPLLAALAHTGAPAGRALASVVAAYWSLRGIVVSIEMRRPPDPMRWVAPAPKGWTDAEIVEAVRMAIQADVDQRGEEQAMASFFLALRLPTWTSERVHALWKLLGSPDIGLLTKDATGIAAVEREQREAGGAPT